MDCWARSPYLLLLLLVSSATVHALTNCTVNDVCKMDCTNCGKYEKVADPDNCRGYYLCQNENATLPMPLLCPAGQVYNSVDHECVTGDTCEPCKASSVACGYDGDCMQTGCEAVAVSFSCKNYIACNVGYMQCESPNPFFDGTSCQSDESRCLHCRAYCRDSDEGEFKSDPRDCRKYYFCRERGFPDEMGKCPDGQYFNSANKNCSNTTTCSIIDACRNVVGDDGCIEPFTCLAKGYFPKCPKRCSSQHYYCATVTREFTDARNCTGEYVFHPDKKSCVSKSQCPY